MSMRMLLAAVLALVAAGCAAPEAKEAEKARVAEEARIGHVTRVENIWIEEKTTPMRPGQRFTVLLLNERVVYFTQEPTPNLHVGTPVRIEGDGRDVRLVAR